MDEPTVTETASQQPLRNWARPFFTIWAGQAFSLVGSSVGSFALVWWLTEASGGSATVLSIATIVALLPGVVLGPFAGALVDRWNRRRVMMVSDTIIALFSAGLAYLVWAGRLQIGHVYAIMFVRALGGAFHWPAVQASTSLMVPREQLSRVAGMNQTLQGVLTIAAPPLGALLMKLLPLYVVMAIDVVTAVLAVVPLIFVPIPQPARRLAGEGVGTARPSLWSDVRYGFAYIWRWKGMFMVLLVAAAINMLVSPGMSLLPVLVTRYFGKGVVELGWMESTWGLGMILGGVVLSAWGGFKSKIVTTTLGVVGMGVGLALVGLVPAPAFWFGLAGVAFAGAMSPIANGPLLAVFQDTVEPEVQGRVFTVIGSISAAAAPVGIAIAGPVADWLGVQVWFILGGLACVVLGSGMFFVPAVRGVEAQGRAAAGKE